jgi:DNA repair exonuclease SbcCD ATPase subunit
MGKIDKDLALTMMKSGEKDSKIAAYFNTSRQAVNLLRKSFTKDDKLASGITKQQPAGHPPQSNPVSDAAKQLVKETISTTTEPENQALSTSGYPSFEQLSDWLVQVIRNAGEVQDLRQKCEGYESKINELQSEIANLQLELQEMIQRYNGSLKRAEEYQQAVRKLGLPPAVK